MLKYTGLAALLAAALAGAAFTKPDRGALHEAAAAYADNSSLLGAVASRVTGLFGNDTYDDYMFFSRYRVYVGKEPKVDCFGAFGKTSCGTPKIEEHT